MILFFDTETTGLPDKGLPRDHPAQPHIVQLAALLMNDEGDEVASLNVIVEPAGYTIPVAASNVHGITTEIAQACGIPLSAAMWPFVHLGCRASMFVAHNAPFDVEMIEIEMTRMPARNYPTRPAKTFCTMEASAPIVNLPPTPKMVAAGINKPKAPKLTEAYRHFFGEDLVGAHDALADVRACARIYFHLQTAQRAA